MSDKIKFCIVGAGNVGTSLTYLLSQAGFEFVGASSRTLESASKACEFAGGGRAVTDVEELVQKSNMAFITTPDDAIEEVSGRIAELKNLSGRLVVAHCSGALSSGSLNAAREAGCQVGSMHPLQSIASPERGIKVLPGSYCCIEGDPTAVELLVEIAEAIGMEPMVIPSKKKSLYHAGAVMACNYLVTLEDIAVRLEESAGIERGDALRALMPLVRGTVDNLDEVGLPMALTGPISRGDIGTLHGHIDSLRDELPGLLPLYARLGIETIEVALRKGTIAAGKAEEMRALLRREIEQL